MGKNGKLFDLVRRERGKAEGGLFVFVEVEFFDFVEEGFVADLEDFGCPFAVPARLL